MKRDERPRKETAIVRTGLKALLPTFDSSPAGLRDRAPLYFAFASGRRRRREIARADIRDLPKTGDDGQIYRLE